LLAQPFDAATLKLTGEPLVIADQVSVSPNGTGYFSASDNGILVYDPSSISGNQQLILVDRAGKLIGPVGAPGFLAWPTLSPDGKRVAVERQDSQARTSDIYAIDLARNVSSRITYGPATNSWPTWSPDGTRIVWRSDRDGAFQIYQKLASGVGQEELLLKSDVSIFPQNWSADGRLILYTRHDPKTNNDVWVLPLEGDRQPYPLVQTPFYEAAACFSPDGHWIAYQSNDQGPINVFVQTFPVSSEKWQISTNGGTIPHWRADGKELFYLSDGKLMAAEVKPGNTFEAGVPQALFDLAPVRARSDLDGGGFAVTADGKRFIFVGRGQGTSNSQYTVVVNWSAELKK
jgi:Tol biopolymer transport system component